MASAAEMLRRLQSINNISLLRDIVYDEIIQNESILRDIKENELEQGNIYSNETTARYKNKEYAQDKHEQNPRAGFGVVDLINSGNYIKSFKLKTPKLNKYKWTATDNKKNKISKKYGDVMSLNQETFDKFQIEIIKPRFVRKLQSIINKK